MNTILNILIFCAAWLTIGAFFSTLIVLQLRSWDIYKVRWCDMIGWAATALAGPIAAIVFLIDFLTVMDSKDFWNSTIWKKRK